MIEITKKSKCCGCEACYNICPKNAIEMCEDEEGFLYPKVNKEKCIKCGLCEKICPINAKKESLNNKPTVIATSCNDKNLRKESTSGGIFSLIANQILKEKGLVYGAIFNQEFKVIHDKIDTQSNLYKMRGSKYVQSRIGNVYREIKNELQKDKIILFSGTPCQIEGLRNFLGKEYENLYCIEIFCKGVPSPKVWNQYVKHQEKKYNSKIKKAYFRKKTYGFHSTTLSLEFENGKKYSKGHESDPMLKLFVKELISRPSCYECNFRGIKRNADFTIGDLWHADKIVKEYENDSDEGVNIVLINTIKGKKLFDKIENIKYKEISLEDGLKQNANGKITALLENPKKDENLREEFFKDFEKEGLTKIIKKYAKVSTKEKIKAIAKPILYKTKLLNKIKKV